LVLAELEELKGGKFWRKITRERVSRWGDIVIGILMFSAFALFITGGNLVLLLEPNTF
jgi:hypothetical protein